MIITEPNNTITNVSTTGHMRQRVKMVGVLLSAKNNNTTEPYLSCKLAATK